MGTALSSPLHAAPAVLEEIVVTAQRRESNIQETPISITNLTGDRLNARFSGGEDVLALSAAAPGLYIETSNGRLAPRFYLRGLGNADFTAAASQPVSLVLDEVPMEKSALKAFPLFDMADIEVIRGPQGTLFGRNTTAGIVKVDSKRPTEETEGYINVSGGNLGVFNAEGALGGTIVKDKLTGRVSLLSQNRSDWVDNGFTGEDDALGGYDVAAMRVQLEWTPSDRFTAWLMHQRQDQDSTTSLFRANVLSQGSNNLNSNFDRDTVFYDGGAGNNGNMKSNGTTLKLDFEMGEYTLTSITSYQDITDRFGRGDIDGGFGCLFTCTGPAGPASTPFSPFASPFVVNVDTGGDIDLEQFTQEIRLASNFSGPMNFQVGAFYFKDDFFGVASNQSAGATTFSPGSTSDIENTTYAFFGQGSYDVNDKLTLTAGIRYTDDDKDATNVRFTATGPQVLPDISLGDDNISWDVSFSYALNEQGQLYGRAASGFRAPTIQDRLEDDPEVTTADSETILSYEIGYKALFSKMRLNVAAFYYTIDDIQLTAVGGASNSTSLLNADEGTGYGVEFEFDYVLTDNLVVSAGYGYNKTEINDSTLAVAPCGSGLCTVQDPLNANGLALIDGNPFQHAPEWTANIELDYTYPLDGGRSELYFFTDWRFKGETNDFLYESIEYTTDTQFEGGVKLGYRSNEDNFQIGFFGRNITDEENLLGGIDFANNTGYVNQPRVWGVEGSYRF
jgi:iron complex outermembrane receptor protein